VTPATDLQRTSLVVLDHPDALEAHVPAWEALARAAIEPNVFQEPWALLPAWRAFGARLPLQAVLVYGPARPGATPELFGLCLLERVSSVFGRLPVPALRTWTHLHGFLGTPLVRAGAEAACLDALFDWLAGDAAGVPLFELTDVGADGPFERHLAACLARRGLPAFVARSYERAVLRRGADTESVLAQAMSSGNRKELRRQRRRLEETGRLEVRALDAHGDLAAWLGQFLELERAGWKGAEGSALGSDPVQRDYFERIARAAHDRGRLMLIGLFLDGTPIAMKCNFLALPAAFCFKIAFDERHARFSPGVQLELENVAAAQARPDLAWMDSCAGEGHFMIERLWSGRRRISTTVIATGRAPGAFVVRCLPLLRGLYRTVRGTPRAPRVPRAR
jgi:CelD/BcsL family acetyltransferase involved in cellulose biosynthesis